MEIYVYRRGGGQHRKTNETDIINNLFYKINRLYNINNHSIQHSYLTNISLSKADAKAGDLVLRHTSHTRKGGTALYG